MRLRDAKRLAAAARCGMAERRAELSKEEKEHREQQRSESVLMQTHKFEVLSVEPSTATQPWEVWEVRGQYKVPPFKAATKDGRVWYFFPGFYELSASASRGLRAARLQREYEKNEEWRAVEKGLTDEE